MGRKLATAVNRTTKTSCTSSAFLNPTSAWPLRAKLKKTVPKMATPTDEKTDWTAESTPLAEPLCWGSTVERIVSKIGAAIRPVPMPETTKAGTNCQMLKFAKPGRANQSNAMP